MPELPEVKSEPSLEQQESIYCVKPAIKGSEDNKISQAVHSTLLNENSNMRQKLKEMHFKQTQIKNDKKELQRQVRDLEHDNLQMIDNQNQMENERHQAIEYIRKLETDIQLKE
jgi:hypothetical protein